LIRIIKTSNKNFREVQGERRENLMERIYIYNYRSFDKRLEAGIPVIRLKQLKEEIKKIEEELNMPYVIP
jgi:hypothetical protein